MVLRQTYQAYGGVAYTNGSGTVRYTFTGKELDAANLYYYGARYYDPEVGRFISVDPAKQGMNWYEYCADNPVKYIDPTGMVWLNPFSWFGGGSGKQENTGRNKGSGTTGKGTGTGTGAGSSTPTPTPTPTPKPASTPMPTPMRIPTPTPGYVPPDRTTYGNYTDYNASALIFDGGLQISDEDKSIHPYLGFQFGTPWPSFSMTGGENIVPGPSLSGQCSFLFSGQMGLNNQGGYTQGGFGTPSASVNLNVTFY